MSVLWMLAAFFILCGGALFFCGTAKMNSGEGMLVSASAGVLLLYLGGLAGSFSYGVCAIGVLSAAGYLRMIYRCSRGENMRPFWRSPCIILLFVFFAGSLLLYYHDFIQHIDEFHQWALSVKYMLREDRLPETSPLLSTIHPYATSLFHLFFQETGGYNEANMYVSAAFLMWIGFLLPFGEYRKADWKKIVIYALILYFGLFSLYYYGVKNLYVDLPVIAWAGGLAGWWMNRTKKKSNFLIAASGLCMLWFFKWMVGPLMVCFVLLFFAMHTALVEQNQMQDPAFRKKVLRIGGIVLAVCVVCAALAGMYLLATHRISAWTDGASKRKLVRTTGAFLTALTGRAFSQNSNLKIAFLPFVAFLLVCMKGVSDLFGQRKQFYVYTVYLAFTFFAYCGALLFAYLFFFGYEESTTAAGSPRYFAVYAVYLFVIVLVWFLQSGRRALHPKWRGYLAAGLLLFFLSGVNQNFIGTMTALDKSRISGGEDITETKAQITAMKDVLTAEDKVYLLDQSGKNEFVTNTALYEMGEQVSNYLSTPWKFTEKGSIIRLAQKKEPSVADFPRLLAQGGYTHVWIYKADEYLKENLSGTIPCGEIKNGCLYRVIYENGEAARLQLEKEL